MPRTWLAPQLDPTAISKCNGKRRRDDLLAIAITRLGSSWSVSWQSSACAASQPLACQDGHRGGARLRRGGERREPGLGKGKASAGGNGAKPEAAGWEGKPKEESQAVTVNNGEWHERVAMSMVASVAQQSVAAEAAKRVSHQQRNAARGPAERER